MSPEPARSTSNSAACWRRPDGGESGGSERLLLGAIHTVKRAQMRPGLNQRLEFWPSNFDRRTPDFSVSWMEEPRRLLGKTNKAAKSVELQWTPGGISTAAGDDKITLKIKDF